MKFIAYLLAVAFVFSGCRSSSQADQALSFRQKLAESNGCSFDCIITADYTDRIYSFAMSCRIDPVGNMEFSVLEPETISGISGRIDNTGGNLTFDSQALAFEVLADGYVSPVSAPWLFIKTLRGGYISSVSTQNEKNLVSIHDTYEEKAMQVDVFFDSTYNLIGCEMIWEGRRILSLTVSNFSYL